jgi:flagellar assembly protein FliH
MSMAQKFLFETCFDAPVPAPFAAPPETVEPAPPETPVTEPDPEPEPTFTEQDLTQARECAFKDGYAEGRREAEDSIDKAASGALETIGSQLETIYRELCKQEEARHSDGLRLAAKIVRKLFPKVAQQQGLAEIEHLIEQCLVRMREEPRLVVRAADPMVDVLRGRIDALRGNTGFEGKVVFIAEDGFGLSDVLVEWADGGAERTLDRQWQEIENLLSHSLEGPLDASQAAARSGIGEPTDTSESDLGRAREDIGPNQGPATSS